MSEGALVALFGFLGVFIGALFTWLATHERIASEAAARHQATEDRVFERIDSDNVRLRSEIDALKTAHAAEVAELRAELTAVREQLAALGSENLDLRATLKDAGKQIQLLKTGVRKLLDQLRVLGVSPAWKPPPGLDHEIGNGS